MREISSRTLNDGSGTVITLFMDGDDTLIVEAVNANGASSCVVHDPHMALDVFNHPFCNEDRLDYPQAGGERARTRPLTPAEYALAEALAVTEVAA